MHAVRRNLQNKIEKLLKIFPVVVILGVRQSGKTTLSKQCCSNWTYFDLENGSDFDRITGDLDFFFRQYPEKIIIDEAQRSEALFRHLRGVIDKNREMKGRFLLTGSSSFSLLRTISESLAGRIGVIELSPLKMNEYTEQPFPGFYQIFMKDITVDTIRILNSLDNPVPAESIMDIFLNGGFPEPLLQKDPLYRSQWFDNYFRTYIERDIRHLFPRLRSVPYRRFIGMLASLSGSIINKSDVGRSLDVSEVTIKEYLQIAEGSYIWRNLASYEKSALKSVVKMPKGLFRDSGLAFFLNNVHNREQMLRYPSAGNLFESFIIEEIIRGLNTTMLPEAQYSYYRTRNGAEVDLILEGSFGILPVEVKFGMDTRLSKLSSLKRFLDQENLPLGLVINNGDEVRAISDKIIQVPAGFI
jgi:uncharacterized protein